MSWTKEKYEEARALSWARKAMSHPLMSDRLEVMTNLLGEALDEIERLTRWRAIETAPKDGTVVLVGWPRQIPWCECAFFREGKWRPSPGLWPEWHWLMTPTHWLPLPEPPEGE